MTLIASTLLASVFLVAFAFVSKAFAETSGNNKKPNIVVIMADDLGWMDLHCYGNKRLDTPALDQLAKKGMRFTDAYAASPVCSPNASGNDDRANAR